jgi:hypothetical protein
MDSNNYIYISPEIYVNKKYKVYVENIIFDFSAPLRLSEKLDHSVFTSWTKNSLKVNHNISNTEMIVFLLT